MEELYKGVEIIVDYKAQNNQDIIDYFKQNTNKGVYYERSLLFIS